MNKGKDLNEILKESLNEILRELLDSNPKITGISLISREGLEITSNLRSDVEMNYIAAIGAALLSLGDRACNEFARDPIEHVVVAGEYGNVIAIPVGEKIILLIDTTQELDFDTEFDFEHFFSRINSIISSIPLDTLTYVDIMKEKR